MIKLHAPFAGANRRRIFFVRHFGGAKEGREGLGPNVSKKDLRQHIFLLLLKKKEEERKKKKKQLQL